MVETKTSPEQKNLIRYLGCVMCGHSTHLSRLKQDSFEKFYGEMNLLQIREAQPGPGRGRKEKGVGGFKVIDELSLSLPEMIASPEYREMGLGIKRGLLLRIKEYIRLGVITREDIKELVGEG